MLEQTQVSYITITTDTETKEIKRRAREESSHLYSPAATYSSFFKHDSKGEKKNRNNKSDYAQTKGTYHGVCWRENQRQNKKYEMETHTETSFSSLHFTISLLNAVGEAAGPSTISAQEKAQKQIEGARSRAR